jgi:sugar O-acyltransferase (sialic acid O-acetyltransferase NeuD family)
MSKKIAIVGASGHGKVVADLAELLGYQVCFFDDAYPDQKHIEHWPVVGDFQQLITLKNQYSHAVVAIGNNNIRQQKIEQLFTHQFILPTLIHPSAQISYYARTYDATVILAGAVVNAFARIGTGCIINSLAVIEHDCKLADYIHICPNTALAGGVLVGDKSWIGIGASVIQLISIGSNVTVGAGTVVIKNISDNVTVCGVPAKVIKD